MGKFGALFGDRYDDKVKTRGSRRDFNTGTFVAVCDKVLAHKTDDDEPRTYLKSYWTILSVERGEGEVGGQHTIAYFKNKKAKFFERDTKALAGALLGLDQEETDALKRAKISETLADGAAGRVLRLRCLRKEQDSKKEEGKTIAFTNVEYLGRLDKEEIVAVFEGDKKALKKLFPQGLDAEGRGIGFGEDQDEPTVENENSDEDGDEDEPAPKPKKKAKPAVSDDEDEDEDEA